MAAWLLLGPFAGPRGHAVEESLLALASLKVFFSLIRNLIARGHVRKVERHPSRTSIRTIRVRSNDVYIPARSNNLSSNKHLITVTLVLSSDMFAAATALPALCSSHLSLRSFLDAAARLPQDSTTLCRFPIRPSSSLRLHPSSLSSGGRHPNPWETPPPGHEPTHRFTTPRIHLAEALSCRSLASCSPQEVFHNEHLRKKGEGGVSPSRMV